MAMTTMMRWVGMRAAVLALCSTTMVGVMVAQDTAPAAPTQQGDGQGPPASGRRGPGGRGGGMGGERQVDMLTKQLNLSADQVTQLKSIDADAVKQLMALRDDTSSSKDDKRAKMMTIRTDSQAKIKAMLDDGQKQKYEKLQAKMQERMGERAMGHGGARGRGMGGNAPPAAPPQ